MLKRRTPPCRETIETCLQELEVTREESELLHEAELVFAELDLVIPAADDQLSTDQRLVGCGEQGAVLLENIPGLGKAAVKVYYNEGEAHQSRAVVSQGVAALRCRGVGTRVPQLFAWSPAHSVVVSSFVEGKQLDELNSSEFKAITPDHILQMRSLAEALMKRKVYHDSCPENIIFHPGYGIGLIDNRCSYHHPRTARDIAEYLYASIENELLDDHDWDGAIGHWQNMLALADIARPNGGAEACY